MILSLLAYTRCCFIYLFFLTVFCCVTQAQEKITVRVSMIDVAGFPITGSYVQIKGNRSQILYSYSHTGDQHTVAVSFVPLADDDSLFVRVSHMAYVDTLLKILIAKPYSDNYELKALMRFRMHNLDEVKIDGSPVWKRGDTTFFRADLFKDGDEKKLKDLIENIPGFEMTDDGRLLYEKRPIEKIRIDGEDLFSDKIKMLLNSFPVHAIHSVQVLENQQENKVMQGMIGGDQLYMNLGIKQNTFSLGFGDLEAGLGTESRYKAAATLFSVANKVKLGFIGDWNTVGNGADAGLLYELKNGFENENFEIMMNNQPINSIMGFDKRFYLRNHMRDNRLQINIPLGNSMVLKTEVNLVSDRQRQNTQSISTLYGEDAYFERYKQVDALYRPSVLHIREEISYSRDSTRLLRVGVGLLVDKTKGFVNMSYLQEGHRYGISNEIGDDWRSYNAEASYTTRPSPYKINLFSLKYNQQYIEQHGWGFSADWPAIFGLGDEYTELRHLPNSRVGHLELDWKYVGKHRYLGQLNTSLYYKRHNLRIQNMLSLIDNENVFQTIFPESFQNQGEYTMDKVGFQLNNNIRFVGGQDIQFSYDLGLQRTMVKDNDEQGEYYIPAFALNINLKRLSSIKILRGDLGASFAQRAVPLSRLPSFIRPASIDTYRKAVVDGKPLQTLSINYNVTESWGSTSNNSHLYIGYSRDFTQFVSLNQYVDFVYLAIDSLVANPTSSFLISLNNRIASLWLNAVVDLKAGYMINQSLLNYKDEVYRSWIHLHTLELSTKKNWNRKYFVNLLSRFSSHSTEQPAAVAGLPARRVSNVTAAINQRLVLAKGMNLLFNASLINNNIFTENHRQFAFLEAEYNYRLKKQPLTLTLRGENLLNQQLYYDNIINPTNQFYYNVPLIGRNIFVSLRYEM